MKQDYEYVNANYDKVVEQGSKAINLTPRSYPRIVNKFMLWYKGQVNAQELEMGNAELERLEERKTEFSKSKYMIEHGSVERVNKRIAEVQELIKFLNEEKDLINTSKNISKKASKPLRLVPKMFKSIKDGFYVATAKKEQIKENAEAITAKPAAQQEIRRNYQEPIIAPDFSRQEEVKQLINEKVNQVNLEDDMEEKADYDHVKQLPSVVPAKLELSVAPEKQTNIDDEFVNRLEKSLQSAIGKEQINNETKQDETKITKNDKETIYEFSTPNDKPSAIDSLENMKNNILKLQQEKEQQARKAEEARQKRENANKAKEEAMNKYIELSKALQEEINKNMKIEQEETAKAEQDIKASQEIEAMLNPIEEVSKETTKTM